MLNWLRNGWKRSCIRWDKENDKAGIFKTYRLFFCIKKRSHGGMNYIKNLQSRTAVLDCVALDAGGRQFNVEILAERVRELKETQEGVDIMCRRWMKSTEKGRATGRNRGEKLGEKRGARSVGLPRENRRWPFRF